MIRLAKERNISKNIKILRTKMITKKEVALTFLSGVCITALLCFVCLILGKSLALIAGTAFLGGGISPAIALCIVKVTEIVQKKIARNELSDLCEELQYRGIHLSVDTLKNAYIKTEQTPTEEIDTIATKDTAKQIQALREFKNSITGETDSFRLEENEIEEIRVEAEKHLSFTKAA